MTCDNDWNDLFRCCCLFFVFVVSTVLLVDVVAPCHLPDAEEEKLLLNDLLSRGDQCGDPIVGGDVDGIITVSLSPSSIGGGGGGGDIDFSNVSFGQINIAVKRVNNGTTR